VPDPDEWYKKSNANEFIITFFDDEGNEIRIRQRYLTEEIANSRKKQVKIFSVGLELEGETDPIVRHCNYNTESLEIFHTHEIGIEEKVFKKLARLKTPGAQLRWAYKDIYDNFEEYINRFKTQRRR